MKIFITGGSGLVGSNLRAAITSGEFFAPTRSEVNLMDYDQLVSAIRQYQPDAIVHCAGAVGGIQANINAPFEFCEQNLQMGINVINAALECEISNLINLGTSCMYPRLAPNPLVETDIMSGYLEPTNEGYAIAKIAVAKLCEYATASKGVQYKTLIPSNLFGKWDNFEGITSHLIPAVIKKIHDAVIAGQQVVEIWGDGTTRRESLYAADLADFILLSLECIDRLQQNTNVGFGVDYSIGDYYSVIAEVIGYTGDFKYDPSKPVGMPTRLVDVSRQCELGWYPTTELKEGIELTYQFFKDTYNV